MIPARAHLVWLGRPLPALAYVAARSALERGAFDQVVLHHDDPRLTEDPLVRDLSTRPGFAARSLTLHALEAVDHAPPQALGTDAWRRIAKLDAQLESPAARSNLHRLVILWLEGGVYLDTDVVVLHSLGPLRLRDGFAGLERICFPLHTVDSLNPLRWVAAMVLTSVREGVARLAANPGAAFRRIERLYSSAANNAVMGAAPAHPLVRDLLIRATSLPRQEAKRRFRLGPRLLQEATGNRSRPDFELLPPATFYPLPPEICRAYVKDDPGRLLGDAPDGPVVAAHLYDSNLRRHLGGDPGVAYFRAARGRTLLARMAEPYLDDLLRAADS